MYVKLYVQSEINKKSKEYNIIMCLFGTYLAIYSMTIKIFQKSSLSFMY